MKKRKPQKSKATCQRIHATKRAKERFGITIGKNLYDKICKDIQNGKCQKLLNENHRVSHWLIHVQDNTLVAVYDKLRKTIVTFLPKGCEKYYGTQN